MWREELPLVNIIELRSALTYPAPDTA